MRIRLLSRDVDHPFCVSILNGDIHYHAIPTNCFNVLLTTVSVVTLPASLVLMTTTNTTDMNNNTNIMLLNNNDTITTTAAADPSVNTGGVKGNTGGVKGLKVAMKTNNENLPQLLGND